MERFFAIGDIHGEIDMMKEMISKWNKKEQQLILVGDLIDRGPDSRACLLYGRELVEKEDAIWLKGKKRSVSRDAVPLPMAISSTLCFLPS